MSAHPPADPGCAGLPAAVFWTAVEPSLLFAADGAAAPAREVTAGHRRILLAAAADGSLTIRRLISTDPADFLDPRLQPGLGWPPAGLL